MNALRKAALTLLWPSMVLGLVSLLAAVALLVLGQIVFAAAAAALCALCAVPVLVADSSQRMTTGSAATSPARTRYVPLP
jgi:hypothetical protein